MNFSRRSFLASGAALACSFAVPARSRAAEQSQGMRLEFNPFELKMAHAFSVSSNTRTTTSTVQVRLIFQDLIGYGEASMPPYLGESTQSVMQFLEQVDLSRYSDPFELETILGEIDAIAPGNTAAKAAIDIALHDWIGKRLGVPCYRLFGGSLDRIPPTTFTIGLDEPEIVRKKTLEAGNQYKILKVKLGREQDKELIETIRSVSSLPIAVDVNQGWKDRHQALDMVHWLKDKGIILIEQPLPVDQLDDSGWLTERSPLPIIADESIQRWKDVLNLKGYFSGINIKLMKATGMREGRKMIELGRACGMKVMLGCMVESSCAIAAAVHLSPFADFLDLDGNLLITNDPFKGVQLNNGRHLPSDRAGLGIVTSD